MQISRATSPQHGIIKIATYEGFSILTLGKIIAQFQQNFPTVQFQVWTGNSAEISQKINNGEADIGIVYNFAVPSQLQLEHTARRPIYILMPYGHPLAAYEKITLADVVQYPFALPNQERTQRHLINTALASAGLSIDPVFTSNSMTSLLVYARETGYLLFSSSDLDEVSGFLSNITAIKIDNPVLQSSVVQIITMKKRQLPPAIQNFLKFLIDAMPNDSALDLPSHSG